MGSIPIIATGIQQGQPPNLLENAQRAQAITSGRQEQQLRSQQVEQGQIQLNDQKAMTSAMQDWDGKDFKELPSLVLKHGGSANAVIGLKQHIVDQQTKLAQLDKDQLSTLATRHDMQAGALSSLNDVPDEQLGASLLRTVQNPQYGFSPQDAQQAFQIAQMDPKSARAHLGLLTKGLQGEKEQVENAAKAAETQKNAALTTEAGANTTKAQADTAKTQEETQLLQKYGGASDAQQQARYLNIKMQQQRGQPVSPEDAAWSKSYEHLKTLVPVANFNLQNAGGQSSPTDPLVQAVANGSMKIGDVITYRTPLALRKEFLQNVMKANPNFNSANYDVEKGVMKDFSSGKSAQNLTAFNTAIDHASQLDKAVDALDNGDVRGLNKVGNALGYQFGSDKTTNFNVIKNALSGEISKVFKGGQATDAEIHSVQQPFDAANSPAQLKGAIKTAIALMNSKRDALKQQYDAGRQAQPNFGNGSGSVSTQPTGGAFDFNQFPTHK